MEVVYTRHVKGRMRWREITKHEVEHTVTDPERKENIGPNRFHCFRHIGQKHLRVTCVVEGEKYIIISAVNKSE